MPRHGHQKGRANSPGRGERAGEAQSDSRGSAAGAALLVPGLTRLRLVLGLLVATVVGSALAVGAVHAVVLLVVAPLAIAAFLSGTWGHTIRSSVPAPALIAAALGGYSALQAVPLPPELVETISPRAAEIWSTANQILGETGRWVSVSLEPGASLREALKWLSYGATFAAAAYVARRKSARPLLALVCASATILAVTTLVHRLLGAETLYGLYAPLYTDPRDISPLVNLNNFGGYLTLGGLVGLGLTLEARSLRKTLAAMAGAATCFAFIPVSMSRGAVVVVIVSVFALLIYLGTNRRKLARAGSGRGFPRRGLVALSLLGVAWGFIAILHVQPSAFNGFTDTSKLGVMAELVPMVGDYPWFGVGRGAFGGISPVYQTTPNVAEYAENFVLQWGAEWGLPVAMAALLSAGWFFRPSRMALGRHPANLGAYFGICALLTQNLLDVAFEVPAVCYAVAVVLGGLWGEGRARTGAGAQLPERARGGRTFSLVAVPTAVAAMALWVGTATYGLRSATDHWAELRTAYEEFEPESQRGLEEFHDTLRRTLRARPADPYSFQLAASVASHTKATQAAPALVWVNRALRRQPKHAPTHLLAARELGRLGHKDQALLELRFAVENGSKEGIAAKHALWLTQDARRILQGVPEGVEGAPMLTALGRAAPRPLGMRLLAESLRRAETLEAHELQGKLVFAAALGKEEPCDTQFERCLESVEYHAERALALEPGSIGGLTLKAALIEGSAGVERAAAYLQERCEALGMPEKCLALRVDYAFKTGIAEGTSAAEDLLAVACARSREHCAVTAETLAGHASRHGHGHLVAKYTWQASRQAPTMGRWIATAENALRVGSVQLSLTAVRKAKALRTDDEALQKRLIRVERAALVQSLR